MDCYDFTCCDKCEMRLELMLELSKLQNCGVLGKSDFLTRACISFIIGRYNSR